MWLITKNQGRLVRVPAVQTAAGIWLGYRGGSVCISQSSNLPTNAAPLATTSTPTQQQVCAPMGGRVLQMQLLVGQRVEAQDLLLLLEAMKMEYRVCAPFAAEIIAVYCSVGEWVDRGAVLVTLNPTS